MYSDADSTPSGDPLLTCAAAPEYRHSRCRRHEDRPPRRHHRTPRTRALCSAFARSFSKDTAPRICADRSNRQTFATWPSARSSLGSPAHLRRFPSLLAEIASKTPA